MDAQDIVCNVCHGAGDALVVPHGELDDSVLSAIDAHYFSTYRTLYGLVGEIPKSREVYNIRNAVDVLKQFSRHFGHGTQRRGPP